MRLSPHQLERFRVRRTHSTAYICGGRKWDYSTASWATPSNSRTIRTTFSGISRARHTRATAIRRWCNAISSFAPQLPTQDYQRAAQEAFSRMSPQERIQFGQYLQQQAQTQGTPVAGFGQGVAQEAYGDSDYLAQQTAQLNQQQPGLLTQLLGGGGTGGVGSMLASPVAKAALAGIAAMAVSKAMGGGTGGNVIGGLLGGVLGQQGGRSG